MADYKSTLTGPGEVNILRLEIEAHGKLLDISALVADLTIYEDIFSNTMSGYIVMVDALDLINTLPLVGEELLHIELETPSLKSKIKKTFYIYKLSSLAHKKRMTGYVLHFCSVELINSVNSKVAKAYKGKITSTVQSIFTDENFLASKQTLVSDVTSNDYPFVAPFWTPLQTINWLTTKSLNSRGVSNFLFFENNKEFEFISIDTLLTSKPVRDYIYSDVGSDTTLGPSASLDQKYNFVEQIEMQNTFDYIRNLSAGMYGGVLYSYDLTTKNIKRTSYDYIGDFGKNNHSNDKPLRSSSLIKKKIASLHFLDKNDYLTGSYKSQKIHDIFLQRNSLLEQISAFKFNIKVFGRTDMQVGQMITYTMPKNTEIVLKEINTDSNSEYFTGKYLVTAIRHQIINGKHMMDMEIVSDSFAKEITL